MCHQVGVDGNKEPFKYIPHEDVVLAVNAIRGETKSVNTHLHSMRCILAIVTSPVHALLRLL
jgi:hypothetical protein